MKLLFDENLPPSLTRRLSTEFPLCQSVLEIGLDHSLDVQIVAYAREHGFIVVTKDVDFFRHCCASGIPPKVIWVRTGNCSIQTLVEALRAARERIEAFERDDQPYLILK